MFDKIFKCNPLLLIVIFITDAIFGQCNVTPPPNVTLPCGGGSTTLNGLQTGGST